MTAFGVVGDVSSTAQFVYIVGMADKFEKSAHKQRLSDLGIPKIDRWPWTKEIKSFGRRNDYTAAHACFDCRVSFKRVLANDQKHSCPQCNASLAEMGRSFKAPRKSEIKQWKKVQKLWEAGYRFPTSSNPAADYPKNLSEVDDFIREHPNHPYRLRHFRDNG